MTSEDAVKISQKTTNKIFDRKTNENRKIFSVQGIFLTTAAGTRNCFEKYQYVILVKTPIFKSSRPEL